MKQLFVLSVLLVIAATGSAQKSFSEGRLTYSIAIRNTKGEPQPGALNNAMLTVLLTKDKSKSTLISSAGSESVIYDNKTSAGFILREYSGQKLLISMNAQNWAQKNRVNNALDFSSDGKTTVINGYSAIRQTATGAEGRTYTVYIDPSVVLLNKNYNNAFKDLNGLPVQFELASGNLVFIYTLVKYETADIREDEFAAPKAGFRTLSWDESQQMKKSD